RMIPARKGKPSLTRWRVIAELNGRALVEFSPETGRTHQIRVHAASGIGIPLLGDPVYGEKAGFARTMLHASRIEVGREGKPPIVAEAPMPADFVAQGF
ncbi:MAG TPA: RNA pseudouridine synthase, partial [Paracoccaceae bacterium]|nr:RNA pseudouridine synthase [Paracoccaceae bacterium]